MNWIIIFGTYDDVNISEYMIKGYKTWIWGIEDKMKNENVVSISVGLN